MNKHSSNFILVNNEQSILYTASSSIISWSIGKELKKINRCSTIDKDIKFMNYLKDTQYIIVGSGRGIQIFDTSDNNVVYLLLYLEMLM